MEKSPLMGVLKDLGPSLAVIGAMGILGGAVCLGMDQQERREQKIRQVYRENQQRLEAINSDGPQITATVLEEQYENALKPVPAREVHIDGLVSQAHAITNETVKVESKYTLKLKTEDGRVIAVTIADSGDRTKESLDMLIESGTRIRFPRDNIRYFTGDREWRYDPNSTYFKDDTQTGTKYADEIKVLSEN